MGPRCSKQKTYLSLVYLDRPVEEEFVNKIFAQFDVDKDGKLNFQELTAFVKAWAAEAGLKDVDRSVDEALRTYNVNEDQTISREEMLGTATVTDKYDRMTTVMTLRRQIKASAEKVWDYVKLFDRSDDPACTWYRREGTGPGSQRVLQFKTEEGTKWLGERLMSVNDEKKTLTYTNFFGGECPKLDVTMSVSLHPTDEAQCFFLLERQGIPNKYGPDYVKLDRELCDRIVALMESAEAFDASTVKSDTTQPAGTASGFVNVEVPESAQKVWDKLATFDCSFFPQLEECVVIGSGKGATRIFKTAGKEDWNMEQCLAMDPVARTLTYFNVFGGMRDGMQKYTISIRVVEDGDDMCICRYDGSNMPEKLAPLLPGAWKLTSEIAKVELSEIPPAIVQEAAEARNHYLTPEEVGKMGGVVNLKESGDELIAKLSIRDLEALIKKTEEKGFEGTDFHTHLVYRGVQAAHNEWKVPMFEKDILKFNPKQAIEKHEFGYGGILVPKHDEDWPDLGLFKTLSAEMLKKVSMRDDPVWFGSIEEGILFSELFFKEYLPISNVQWREFESDGANEEISFKGLGQVFLQGTEGSTSPEKPDNAVFQSDLTMLSVGEVREGFEKYGAVAYFDKDKKFISIYLSHSKKSFFPNSSPTDWSHAKFMWRSSMFVLTTLREHLIFGHWIVSNSCCAVVQETMEPDHPIRRMFKPFTFRTSAINYKSSTSLLPVNGVLHRATALEADSLSKVFEAVTSQFKYETFEQWLNNKKLPQDALEELPCYQDGRPYHQAVKNYVTNYVNIYFPTEEDVTGNNDIKAMWEGVEKSITAGYGLPELSKDALIDYATSVLFYVTGLHEWVGNVTEYATVPNGMAGKIRIGAVTQDKQAFIQMQCIAGLTGLRQPPLYADWTCVFLEDDNHGKAVDAYNKFMAECRVLDKEVDEKNLLRTVPFVCFQPVNMEGAISI